MEPGPKHQIGSNVLVIFRKYEKKKAKETEDEHMSRERPWISSGTIQGRK